MIQSIRPIGILIYDLLRTGGMEDEGDGYDDEDDAHAHEDIGIKIIVFRIYKAQQISCSNRWCHVIFILV